LWNKTIWFVSRRASLGFFAPHGQPAEANEILLGYCAHMTGLDECFSKLLQTLDRTGAAEDTIVVFTSDHLI